MAAEAAAAAIGAGGELAGGALGAIGQGQANAREGRLSATQAGTLADFISSQVLTNQGQSTLASSQANSLFAPSDTRGLEAQANRVITRGQQNLNASLGGAGLLSSGQHLANSVGLRGEVLGGLAQAINQDEFARSQAIAQDDLARDQAIAVDAFGRTQLGAEILSNPVFGFYDPNTKTAANQGAK